MRLSWNCPKDALDHRYVTSKLIKEMRMNIFLWIAAYQSFCVCVQHRLQTQSKPYKPPNKEIHTVHVCLK